MAAFDPAAWVAEYEAIGGRVSVTSWAVHDEEPRQWLGLTYPRDEVSRGRRLQRELNDPPGDAAKTDALTDYVIEARGVRTFAGERSGTG